MHDALRSLCKSFLDGDVNEAAFLQQCLKQASHTLPMAEVDLDRPARCGFPEVIYAEGKSNETVVQVAQSLLDQGQPVLATRVSDEQASELHRRFPNGICNAEARTFRISTDRHPIGKVAVVTAGSTDRYVALEAIETLHWMNVRSVYVFDVGVAGPHRLAAHASEILHSDAVVVAAGMEGALPSVVGGYVNCPVIAVPTSVGYGASLHGFAALLAMLNSCAANVAVVNIDAGFKAGYLAGLIAHRQMASKDAESSSGN